MDDRNWQEILRQQSDYINILEGKLRIAEYRQERHQTEVEKYEEELKRLRGEENGKPI